MSSSILEANYPLSFRKRDATFLGTYLKNRHSVVLIGMKRVGISNFLRFFLSHKQVSNAYINDGKSHLFIPVDLNDLVEREVFPFWVLTLKRIVDAVNNSGLSLNVKKHTEMLFLDSIQSQDLFLTIDAIRKSLLELIKQNVFPTIFYLRFDRMKDAITPELFDNLQGLIDAANRNLSYVFTSDRNLDSLSPEVFTKASVAVFAQNLYIKPADKQDAEIIFSSASASYKLSIPESLKKDLFSIIDGYNQYLQYSLIFLHERKIFPKTRQALFDNLIDDERIVLQSEELWESLSNIEQKTLLKIAEGENPITEERKDSEYLWATGILNSNGEVFSPLFEHFIHEKKKQKTTNKSRTEFSKKENSLLQILISKQNEICEREEIIEAVWPEVEALGVSDWAIDRLVARLRAKLKTQKSSYEIITVKTRGYKLITTH